MKKRFAIVIALVACLALGMVSVSIGKPGQKVTTNVTLDYNETGNPPYNQATFSGKVKAKKGCKKNRKIKLPGVGNTKSNQQGRYSISLNNPASPGTYQATAKKKKIKKNGKKIVCKKGKSNKLTVS